MNRDALRLAVAAAAMLLGALLAMDADALGA